MPITIGGLKRKILNKYVHFTFNKKVKNKSFSILCNNCWAGHIYQQLDLPYNTPTVGLFFYAPCYIKFLENLNFYLSQDLKFTDSSKYPLANDNRIKEYYPIGVIGDIEIQFLHYNNEEEAQVKWNKRKARLNFDNLFVVGSERDLCTKELIERFIRLPYKNKIFFTAKKYPDQTDILVHIKEYEKQGEIGDIYTKNHLIHKYFNVSRWLNKGN